MFFLLSPVRQENLRRRSYFVTKSLAASSVLKRIPTQGRVGSSGASLSFLGDPLSHTGTVGWNVGVGKGSDAISRGVGKSSDDTLDKVGDDTVGT